MGQLQTFGPPSPLVNHRGQPLRVLETPGDPGRVAMFYPGMGYGPMAPVFFSLDQALGAAGWSVLAVDYRYNENTEYLATSGAARDEWFRQDSLAIGRWVAARTAGCRVAFVAKSMGTSMLAHQVRAGLVPPGAELVWLTPGSTARDQFELLPQLAQRSLIAYGTADPLLASVPVRPLGLPRVTVVEVAGAGHSFEVAGDVRRSLSNVADVVEAVSAFLGLGGNHGR